MTRTRILLAALGGLAMANLPVIQVIQAAGTRGAIVPSPGNPAWLMYENGEPFFMCGPGDPEGFLYRGAREPDGTRAGDQMALIEKLSATGANSIYLMAVRSHGGDGDETENPFIDNQPDKGLNPAVLDQWNVWFEEMDRKEIVVYFFLYDDSARIWDTGDFVGADERRFIHQIVKRFAHIDHLIWAVAEEYQERFTPARVREIAKEIRAADDRNHPIAVHKLTGLDFSEFAEDANIDQFAIQYNEAKTRFQLHDAMVAAWRAARGRYNLNMAEIAYGEIGTGRTARANVWSIAMGGAYIMQNGMDIANTPPSDLRDCGRLVEFMVSAGFADMAPHDELAFEGTEFLLARPGKSYVAYAGNRVGRIGVRGMTAGRYGFRWLDLASGHEVSETDVEVASGAVAWMPPPGIGPEIVVYIWRQ